MAIPSGTSIALVKDATASSAPASSNTPNARRITQISCVWTDATGKSRLSLISIRKETDGVFAGYTDLSDQELAEKVRKAVGDQLKVISTSDQQFLNPAHGGNKVSLKFDDKWKNTADHTQGKLITVTATNNKQETKNFTNDAGDDSQKTAVIAFSEALLATHTADTIGADGKDAAPSDDAKSTSANTDKTLNNTNSTVLPANQRLTTPVLADAMRRLSTNKCRSLGTPNLGNLPNSKALKNHSETTPLFMALPVPTGTTGVFDHVGLCLDKSTNTLYYYDPTNTEISSQDDKDKLWLNNSICDANASSSYTERNKRIAETLHKFCKEHGVKHLRTHGTLDTSGSPEFAVLRWFDHVSKQDKLDDSTAFSWASDTPTIRIRHLGGAPINLTGATAASNNAQPNAGGANANQPQPGAAAANNNGAQPVVNPNPAQPANGNQPAPNVPSALTATDEASWNLLEQARASNRTDPNWLCETAQLEALRNLKTTANGAPDGTTFAVQTMLAPLEAVLTSGGDPDFRTHAIGLLNRLGATPPDVIREQLRPRTAAAAQPEQPAVATTPAIRLLDPPFASA